MNPEDHVLFCPKCKQQHLDVGIWRNRPHHKHLCETTPRGMVAGCGHLWRPKSDVETRGVFTLERAIEADVASAFMLRHFKSTLGEDSSTWNRDKFLGAAFGALGLTHVQGLEIFNRWQAEMEETLRAHVLQAMASAGTSQQIIEHLQSIGWKPPT